MQVILMAGLQGVGKTTQCGKLANTLTKGNKKVHPHLTSDMCILPSALCMLEQTVPARCCLCGCACKTEASQTSGRRRTAASSLLVGKLPSCTIPPAKRAPTST